MQKIEYMEDFYNRPINIAELKALGEDGWILSRKAEGDDDSNATIKKAGDREGTYSKWPRKARNTKP